MFRTVCLLALALAAAGCASAPPVVTTRGVAISTAPQSFDLRLAEPVSGVETAAAEALAQRLVAAGWDQTNDNPDVVLEVAYTTGPDTLGAYAGDTPPAEDDAWLDPPARPSWWARPGVRHALSVRRLDPTTGWSTSVWTAAVRTRKDAPAPVSDLSAVLVRSWSQIAGSATPNRDPSGAPRS